MLLHSSGETMQAGIFRARKVNVNQSQTEKAISTANFNNSF